MVEPSRLSPAPKGRGLPCTPPTRYYPMGDPLAVYHMYIFALYLRNILFHYTTTDQVHNTHNDHNTLTSFFCNQAQNSNTKSAISCFNIFAYPLTLSSLSPSPHLQQPQPSYPNITIITILTTTFTNTTTLSTTTLTILRTTRATTGVGIGHQCKRQSA